MTLFTQCFHQNILNDKNLTTKRFINMMLLNIKDIIDRREERGMKSFQHSRDNFTTIKGRGQSIGYHISI